MQNILNIVRNFDLFAVPVSLTYKGKTRFTTLCGGCFSLFLIVCFFTYAGIALHQLITDPELKGNAEVLYFSRTENTEFYNITTNDSTLAVQIDGYPYTTERTNYYLRVVF